MKTITKTSLRTLLAAAALAVVALSHAAPASAAVTGNGGGANGLSINGFMNNGLSINGFVNNGLSLNGGGVNGFQNNGVQASGAAFDFDTVTVTGKEALRKSTKDWFTRAPRARSEVIERMVMGPFVVDHERLTGVPDGSPVEVIGIFEVRDSLIRRVWFVPPPPRTE